jgi:hypothetical protein
MSRFVRPETVTLKLSGGDTLTVRKRLTAGEARARVERWTETDPVTGELRAKVTRGGLATITAYLVDWTLTDDAGRLVDLRGLPAAELEGILDNLESESFTEIRQAIEAHELAVLAEREAQKKTAGPSASDPTSPLLAGVAGGTNG